jgi:hypothetical protein
LPKIIIDVGTGQNAEQILAALKAQLGNVADSVSLVSENTKRLEKEQRRAEYAFRSTAASLDPAIAKSQQYATAQGTLGEALKRNLISQEEHDRLLAAAKDRYDETSSSLAQFADRYNATAASLDPAIAKTQEYTRTQETLAEALRRGLITQEEHDRLLGLAKEKHDEAGVAVEGLLSKYISGATVVAAFTLALSASLAVLEEVKELVQGSVEQAAEAERVGAQLEARIVSTGGAAQLTGIQIGEMANELQNASKFDDESLLRAANSLLSFTSISGDTFERTLGLVSDMSTALGTDLVTNAKLVGRALEDPVKGMQALGRAGVVFSESEKEVIKTLVETGHHLEAQDRILDALATRYGGAGAADVATFGGSLDRVNNLWGNFLETVGEGVLPILSTFLTQVGNIIIGNQELAETLGVLVTQGGRVAAVFVSAGADGARAFLEMASTIMGALASIAEAASGAADAMGMDGLADGLREAADGQRQNAEIAGALAKAAGQVSDAAFLAAVSLEKEGDAALTGSKHAKTHAANDEEAAKAAAKFAKELRGLLDDLDPIGKAEREAAEGIAILNKALAEGMDVKDYQAAVAQLTQKLNDARAAAIGLDDAVKFETLYMDRWADFGGSLVGPQKPVEIPATLVIEGGSTQFDRDSQEAADHFSENMEAGLVSASETFFAEVMQGGDDAWKHLGENLTQVLLQSVAEWLTEQLAAIATAALASKAIKGGSGGTGGVDAGSLAGAGQAAGMSYSSMGIIAIFAAAYMYADSKMKKDAAQRYGFGTTLAMDPYGRVGVTEGASDASKAISESMRMLVSAFEESTGHFIESLQGITIMVRNDGKRFEVMINGELFKGAFHTMGEAIVAGFQEAMRDTDLSALDPAIKDLITDMASHFTDPAAFMDAVNLIQDLSDLGSGLTEADRAITVLLPNFENLEAHLESIGITVANATRLAGNALVEGLNNERDSITGRQRTFAEEMEIQQQRALLFNANVELVRAEMELRKSELEQRLALLRGLGGPHGPGGGGGGDNENNQEGPSGGPNAQHPIGGDDYENTIQNTMASTGSIVMDALVAQMKMYGVWAQSTTEMTAATLNAQVSMTYAAGLAVTAEMQALLDSIAAIEAVLANLPKPIMPGEVHVGGRGRHGGGNVGNIDIDTGPTPAEQRALDFDEFLRNEALAGLSDVKRQIEDLNAAYAAQAEAAGEVEGGEARLAASRLAALARLREGQIDGLGLPMESVRDRMAGLAETLTFLRDSAAESAENADDLVTGIRALTDEQVRYQQVLSELAGQAEGELLGIAADLADTLGMDSEAAELRRLMAEAEWDFKVAEFRFLYAQYSALGLISDEVAVRLKVILGMLNDPANRPDFGPPPPTPNDGHGGQDDALDAMAALTDALEDLADLQREFWASDLSPLNAEQQAAFLRDQLQGAYAQAQASHDPADIRAFRDLVRDYLSSYQDAYGSTGGYTAEFLRINELINNLLAIGGIGGVVPGPGWPGGTAGTGQGGWRPTPGGQGAVLPFERSGGPASPFVVESPALSALADLTRGTNARLDRLESHFLALGGELRTMNRQNGTLGFLGRRNSSPTGLEGPARRQRRGA